MLLLISGQLVALVTADGGGDNIRWRHHLYDGKFDDDCCALVGYWFASDGACSNLYS